MSITFRWAALAALVAATASCSTPGHDADERTADSAAASPSASVSASSPSISVATAATFTISNASVGPLAIDAGKVAFPMSDDRSANWNKVVVGDLNTQKSKVVAESSWPRGFINWVAVSGDWVAWVDQSSRQSDNDPNVLWKVLAVNLDTGTKRQLASNGATPDPFVPQVQAGDGFVFWTQAEPDRSAQELTWKVGSEAPRHLLRHAEMTPGSESATRGQLVFLSRAAGENDGHTVGGDCWTVPLAGGAARPLTHTALAMGCAVSGDQLVWTQHIDPAQKPLPKDGVLDDPYMVVASKIDGTETKILHRGYLSMGYPVTGDDFIVLPVGNSVRVQAISSHARTRLPRGTIGPSVRAGDGNVLAFTTVGGGETTVHVVTVSMRP